MFKKYETIADSNKRKLARCRLILNRENLYNEENIVLIWNNSKEKEELDNEMEKIYLEAISSGDDQFSSRNLTCYSNYARLYLAMSDKNRFYK